MLLGLDSITGLQTARLLADRGVAVAGVARDRRHFAARSRRVEEVVEAVPEESRTVLEHLDRSLREPFVVIACSDDWVEALARSRSAWPSNVRCSVPDPEVVDCLMDKVAFSRFVNRHGFAAPRTAVVRDRETLGQAVRELSFPLVVKPGRKPSGWDAWMGGKVTVADHVAELLAVADRALERSGSLVVQEWVGGGEDALISFNGYFDRHSQPLAAFMARKLRQWPPGAGTSASGEEIRDDEVMELAIELFQKAGFHGLAYLEVKRRRPDGVPLIIEANVGRPTGRAAICEAGGVELVYSAYRDALDLPPLAGNEQTHRGVRWVYLRHDLQAAAVAMRQRRLTLRGWLRSLRGPKVFAVWSWRDPLPFLVDIGRTVGEVVAGWAGKGPGRTHRRGRV